MSFRVWFKEWIGLFFRLLTLDTKKRRSDAQRKRDRERRLKAKGSSANYFRARKKRRRGRRSYTARDARLLGTLLKLMALSIGILLLPLGLFDWGHKSVKARKGSCSSGASKNASQKTRKTATAVPVGSYTSKAVTRTASKKPTAKHTHTAAKNSGTNINPRPQASSAAPHRLLVSAESEVVAPIVEKVVVAEPDESTPKSVPRNETDQYIRKRMIIAGSYYCDSAVLDKLAVGSHIDLEAEPDNPYDKDAIKLLYEGQKIGYIAKKDHLGFVTCLKLKRKIYGVITAVIEEDGQTKYEYETWFESR